MTILGLDIYNYSQIERCTSKRKISKLHEAVFNHQKDSKAHVKRSLYFKRKWIIITYKEKRKLKISCQPSQSHMLSTETGTRDLNPKSYLQNLQLQISIHPRYIQKLGSEIYISNAIYTFREGSESLTLFTEATTRDLNTSTI